MKRGMIALTGALGVVVLAGGVAQAANEPQAQRQSRGMDEQLQSTQRDRQAGSAATLQSRAGSAAQPQSAVGTVAKIDKETRQITLQLSSGEQLMLQVDPSVKLTDIKEGDQVAVNYKDQSASNVQKSG